MSQPLIVTIAASVASDDQSRMCISLHGSRAQAQILEHALECPHQDLLLLDGQAIQRIALRVRDDAPHEGQECPRLLGNGKRACAPIPRMWMPLGPSAVFQAVEDTAQRRRIQRDQLRESALCDPRILGQSEQHPALCQVELPITLMKASGVEATGIDEIKAEHGLTLRPYTKSRKSHLIDASFRRRKDRLTSGALGDASPPSVNATPTPCSGVLGAGIREIDSKTKSMKARILSGKYLRLA
jgi:hypothetical protein